MSIFFTLPHGAMSEALFSSEMTFTEGINSLMRPFTRNLLSTDGRPASKISCNKPIQSININVSGDKETIVMPSLNFKELFGKGSVLIKIPSMCKGYYFILRAVNKEFRDSNLAHFTCCCI